MKKVYKYSIIFLYVFVVFFLTQGVFAQCGDLGYSCCYESTDDACDQVEVGGVKNNDISKCTCNVGVCTPCVNTDEGCDYDYLDTHNIFYCSCGDSGNQCCDGGVCTIGRTAYNWNRSNTYQIGDPIEDCTCEDCGETGSPCCGPDRTCNDGEDECNLTTYICEGTDECGLKGKLCCEDDPVCNDPDFPDLLCMMEICADPLNVAGCDDDTVGLCGLDGGCQPGYECQKHTLSYSCKLNTDKCPVGGEPVDTEYHGPIIETLGDIINPIAKILYFGGLFIGISFIIYAGYRLMMSQGNPQVTKDAQEQLTAAILGIMFILLSAAILRIILVSIFGTGFSI